MKNVKIGSFLEKGLRLEGFSILCPTQGCINRPRIGEDFSSETSLPSFPHIGNVGITRKTMESTAELILCGS